MNPQVQLGTRPNTPKISINQPLQPQRPIQMQPNNYILKCPYCKTGIPIQDVSKHRETCEARKKYKEERSASRDRPLVLPTDRQSNPVIHRVSSQTDSLNRQGMRSGNNRESVESGSRNGGRNNSNDGRPESRSGRKILIQVTTAQNSPRQRSTALRVDVGAQLRQESRESEQRQARTNYRETNWENTLRQQIPLQARNNNFQVSLPNITIPRPQRIQTVRQENQRTSRELVRNQEQRNEQPRNSQSRRNQQPRNQQPRQNQQQRRSSESRNLQPRRNEQPRNQQPMNALNQRTNNLIRPNSSQPRSQNTLANQPQTQIIRPNPGVTITYDFNGHRQVIQGARSEEKPRRKSLTVSKINRLPKVNFEPTRQKYSDQCTICCEDFRKDEEVVKFDTCKHCFHFDCIAPCLKLDDRCPNCRQEVKVPKKKV